jgi:GNAT superfamily N-acetyltransferase
VRKRVLPARSQRFATYARILVHDHDADAARLAALAEGCRTEGTRALAEVCHRCRIGYVGKLSINEEYQGLGLGSSVLAAAREEAPAPDHCWWTSHQDGSAQPFWQLIGSRTGAGYQFATESICPHVGE